MALADRFAGSLLGLALGDAIGAHYEGGVAGALVWRTLGHGSGRELRWTDDTQMALGLAASLAERDGLDEDHVAARWAADCDWRRGYGAGARRLLAAIREGADWREANRRFFPDGSFGNGAAMRAAPIGLFFHDDADARDAAAIAQSVITHAHPLGIEGSRLIAAAVAHAVTGGDPAAFAWDSEHPEYGPVDPDRLGNSVLAHQSAPTAVHIAGRFADRPFDEMMAFVIKLGGDTDTIGAMAGGIWGAWRGCGDLPKESLALLEARERIESAARALLT